MDDNTTAPATDPPPDEALSALPPFYRWPPSIPAACWGSILTIGKVAEKTYHHIQRSTRLLALAPAPAARDEQLVAAVAEVSATEEEIGNLLSKISAKLEKLSAKLNRQVNELESTITGREEWYFSGDFTALTYGELDKSLERQSPQNAERFGSRLRDLVLGFDSSSRPADEGGVHDLYKMFIQKVSRAVQALRPLGADGTFQAFHVLIAIGIQRPFCSADHVFHALSGVLRSLGQPNFAFAAEVPNLVTTDEPLEWQSPAFWGFAAARRVT
ncbi:hypothetical protein LTR36_010820 [Oleoguttula mirabilis]|uniref:Uncharacterized protein n=1 Tax=Oleoguttula mirabilis TaxID=1507867 RepID=A0AAV9JU58_9PEZI|nr:hypothetical protein LTR36_010820 [Oleoguttula mirabilis]